MGNRWDSFYIVPMPYDPRYNKSVSDHVTNKYNGAYASNVIIVRSSLLSSLKLPKLYFQILRIV